MRDGAGDNGAGTETGCALVTGGSRGIGAGIVRALADAGWRVGVNYRSNDEAAEGLVAELADGGRQALAVRGDVRDRDSVGEVFERLEAEYGPVLVLVNCAGTRVDRLTAQIADDDWAEQVDTNLTAPMLTCRRAIGGMLRARFGRIVNIASVVGIRANPGQAAYAATKSGLIGFSKCLAAEVARRRVTVNVIAPGYIETDLTADLPAERVLPLIPARRAGTPEDVAACVSFLASPGAGYVTGTVLVVDGGLSA